MQLFRAWPDVTALATEWDALLVASSAPSVFLTSDWVNCWREVYGADTTPFLLECRDVQGVLLGFAPLCVLRSLSPWGFVRVLRFMCDQGDNGDGLGVVAHRGKEESILESILSALEATTDQWDLLELDRMPSDAPTTRLLREGMRRRGWLVGERTSPHTVVSLTSTWEELLHQLSRKARTVLRRRLAGAGALRSRQCLRHDELPYYLDALFTLHGRRWSERGERGSFHLAARRRFYERIAARLLDHGRLDFDLLELDGRPIAAQFGFRFEGTYSRLQAGFDPSSAHYSPGVVLTSIVMRRLIDDGIQAHDFLKGDEEYKLRWSPRLSSYTHLTVVRPGSIGSRYLSLARAGARWRAGVRRRLPTIWRHLRRMRANLQALRS